MELSKITDWKQFERFCADLMQAEGFLITSEPFVDTDGVDFNAVESYRSHSSERAIEVSWRVQCKHYAASGIRLGRQETEKIIFNYEANRKSGEGLFIIVSTDCTQRAINSIETYVGNKKDARISIWNERQLLVRLERHPEIAKRYNIEVPPSNYVDELSKLRVVDNQKILLVSDQSAFAHNLVNGLGSAGFEVIYIPFWNYHISSKLLTLSAAIEIQEIDLVVCFLGDSFTYPIPSILTSQIRRLHTDQRTPVLFFPFFAWSLSRGAYQELAKIIPVTLIDSYKVSSGDTEKLYQAGSSKLGDFRFLLAFDSFAEDQYVEVSPETMHSDFSKGIDKTFGISHSYEYLDLLPGAIVAARDTTGNPFLVISEASNNTRVAYLNSCCHSCLTLTPVSSPIEASQEFAIFLRNTIEWLIKKS